MTSTDSIIVPAEMLELDEPDFAPQEGKHYRHTLMYDGHRLPVTNMFDNYGMHEPNPLRAFSCVCYIGHLSIAKDFTPGTIPGDAGKWLVLCVMPGDIAPIRKSPC